MIPAGDLPDIGTDILIACIETSDKSARTFVALTDTLEMGAFKILTFEAVKTGADGENGTASMPSGRPGDHFIELYFSATYQTTKSSMIFIRKERAIWAAS